MGYIYCYTLMRCVTNFFSQRSYYNDDLFHSIILLYYITLFYFVILLRASSVVFIYAYVDTWFSLLCPVILATMLELTLFLIIWVILAYLNLWVLILRILLA